MDRERLVAVESGHAERVVLRAQRAAPRRRRPRRTRRRRDVSREPLDRRIDDLPREPIDRGSQFLGRCGLCDEGADQPPRIAVAQTHVKALAPADPRRSPHRKGRNPGRCGPGLHLRRRRLANHAPAKLGGPRDRVDATRADAIREQRGDVEIRRAGGTHGFEGCDPDRDTRALGACERRRRTGRQQERQTHAHAAEPCCEVVSTHGCWTTLTFPSRRKLRVRVL